MRPALIARVTLFVVAAALAGSASLAQGTTGTLSGRVTHEGAPLPGATVTIASPALQGERAATASVNGDYVFHALPPGAYTVTFEMEGMQSVVQPVRVGLAASHRVDAALLPAAVAAAVTVTATTGEMSLAGEVQTNFDAAAVDLLPVSRTIQGTIDLAPGVTTDSQGLVVVSGAWSYDTLYLINGGVTNENLRGQTDNLYIEDAIQEITVLRGAISAEYGRFTGGVVSVITKSGGNELSGSFRNGLTNPAWSKPSAYGEAKAESELFQTYEATLGGRIVRDKLWFFGAGRHIETAPRQFYMQSDEEISPRDTDQRYEIKLTGQLTPSHSVVGSFLSYDVDQKPYCQSACWEPSSVDLDGRSVPREFLVARYNGVLTTSLLVEAGWSSRDLVFVDSGGNHQTTDYTDPRDIALGTYAYDLYNGGYWGAPPFCVPCSGGQDDLRESESFNLKGTWYAATAALGTHNVVAGYESFAESRKINLYYSGSLLTVYTYSGIAPTRVGPASQPGTLRPVIAHGDVFFYSPVDEASRGSDFVTESVFLNDRWDLGAKWSFNVGVRYDRNDGKDGMGNTISRDSNVSPRLGARFDLLGDGRYVVDASFSRYVSRVQESVGGANGSGAYSDYRYWYDGPQIGGPDSGLSSFDVLEQFAAWLLAQGWTPQNRTGIPTFVSAFIPGTTLRLDGTLQSPYADERTIGFAAQLGRGGFVRLDYIDKSWGDFYVSSTTPGDFVDVLGRTVDVQSITNCGSCRERTYEAVQVQGSYRIGSRLSSGLSYTWSESRGNIIGEGGGFPGWDNILTYREYNSFPRHRPTGLLGNDQTHKLRFWLGYDIPLGRFGHLNTSLLQRFDSGRPYTALAQVNVRNYVSCHPCGYATPPVSRQYFFSERGEYRWDDATATDLALNYELPLPAVSVFLQGEVLNLFNEQAQTSGFSGIRVLQRFDPFTETPVEGVHWMKPATFGQPFGPGSFQPPRTWRASIGLRF